jgi:uncharacterized membrane protein
MQTVEKSVEIDVPVRTAYNQWTQFESFPRFMDGLDKVKQLDDTHLHWVANIGGHRREWDAEIVEQFPDDHISWVSRGGERNAGIVRFYPLDNYHTEVTLQFEYEPEGLVENVGSALGFVSRRVEHNMKCFKDFIELRGQETGAWRGTVQQN